ncbi:hypothetical protein FOB58_005480 [Candida parapsilosis]|nr:hypothetical protein FOB58_005480 [Candida parapsilosis]
MKFLTTNFVQCAVKSCQSSSDSFPLKYEECQLVQEEQEFKPEFIVHMLEKLDWNAVISVAKDWEMIHYQQLNSKNITSTNSTNTNNDKSEVSTHNTGPNDAGSSLVAEPSDDCSNRDSPEMRPSSRTRNRSISISRFFFNREHDTPGTPPTGNTASGNFSPENSSSKSTVSGHLSTKQVIAIAIAPATTISE